MKAASLRHSLTFRVTIAYLLSLALTVAVLLAAAFWFGVQAPLDRMKRLVLVEARQVQAIYEGAGPAAASRKLEQRRRDPNPTMAFDALISADGTVVSANLPSWPQQPREGWQRFEADLYRDGDEDDHEALSIEARLKDGGRLIVGRDIEAIADRQEMIEEGALWGSIGVLVLGLVGGLAMSRTIGARLERVNRTALTVMSGNLGGRIETSGTDDDFDRLSRTLNAMLDRIEELIASVSRVSDSIAHELRTPLTRLRSELEELAQATAGEPQNSLVVRALGETERLQNTFDALLRIARLETGRHAPIGEAVLLDAILADAVELYEPEAERKRLTMALGGDRGVRVKGDRNLLFQAIANLIDNAVKFAPEGGRVDLLAHDSHRGCAVTVRDNGPGVPPEHRGRLTERFYRAPGAESIAGTGLGLSLVAAVARAHGAVLSFGGTDAGFEARLTFPPSSRATSDT